MRLLLIGFGNVGQELAKILISQSLGYPSLSEPFTVTGITTATKGSLYSKDGIDLETALENIAVKGRFSTKNPQFSAADSNELISREDFDALVELTTLSIERRGRPASNYIEMALQRGKDCVTANKGPVAFAFNRLVDLARAKDRILLYESTVMDGAPIFNLARYSLRGCSVRKVEGVLNATSNYVLTSMEQGKSSEQAICRGRSGA